MNKFALIGLLAVAGSASAFSPANTNGRTSTELASTIELGDPSVAAYTPLTEAPLPSSPAAAAPVPVPAAEPYLGEYSVARAATYVSIENEEASLGKGRLSNPFSWQSRQIGPVSLTEIRAQQRQHGMHTTTDGIDHTRRAYRH